MSSTRKVFRSTRYRLALALAALAFWPAIAVSAPTIDRTTYFEFKGKACANAAGCQSVFTAVPVGKFLLVQRVTCVLILPSTAKISTLQLRQGVGNPPTVGGFQVLAPVQEVSDNGTTKNYLLNADTLIAVQAGEVPMVFVELRASATSIIANCSVLGTITN
jgi:hypothetical protein